MRRILKALIRFVLVVVPILVMAVGAGFLWLSRSLPPEDGEMTIAGLSGPVTITRDKEGVPHIVAETRADAAVGLGFVHAQERLWQMHVNRMAGRGRLSELFGAPTVATDIWLRTMAIDKAAEASLSVLDAPTTAMLDGYARGVNAWIEREARAFSSKLPPEFVILGAEPEPWTPADTLTTIKIMSVTLSENVGDEVLRLAFSRLGFSEPEINDLLPYVDADSPPPLPDLVELLGLERGPIGSQPSTADNGDVPVNEYALVDEILGSGASNNWVVSGARTESGKPILANDPHLSLGAPSIWYLAHVTVTKELGEPKNLIGASLPGTPFIFLGRNDFAAWGYTNTATDAQDLFVERVNPDNPDEYLTPSGWATFGKAEETIRVKGGTDVSFTRRWTRHGPVLPGSYRKLETYLPKDTVAALQWVALAPDDTTANAGPRLYEVRSVADYQKAMDAFVTPMQSMVVADVDGNIGLIAPGRVPVRDPANQVMGRAPVPGWNAIYDWRGYVPFAGLPRQLNPAIGAIGTANTKIVGPDYPHLLTFDWEEPYRQARVDELVIHAGGKHTVEASRAAQADIHSAALLGMRDRFVRALEGAQLTTLQRGLIARLSAWDGAMTADRGEPLIMMAWFREMTRRTFADELGPAFETWFKLRGKVLEQLLDGRSARATWCDLAETPQQEGCAEILIAALDGAVADLKARYGDDIDGWRWGKAHKAIGAHRPFANVEWLAPLFNVEIEHGGGPFTLDRGATEIWSDASPYANTHGSSYRGIFDLADLDASTYIQTTGQSGNVFSRHYRDFAERWARVEGITIPAGGPSEPAGRWTLSPGR
jgi:Protein related to penicillin acylase